MCFSGLLKINMDFVDSNYEFNAPQYVDFLNDADDKNVDKWFDEHPGHEGGIRLSMVPFFEKPSNFESVTKAISAALNENLDTQPTAPQPSQAEDVATAEPTPASVAQQSETTQPMDVDDIEMVNNKAPVSEKSKSEEVVVSKEPIKKLSNLRTSWDDTSDSKNRINRSLTQQEKPKKPMTRSRSLERPKALKRKSSSERKTKDEADGMASQIKKSKMEIKRPMLTIARTPELLKRTQEKKTSLLSSEQAELEMVKKLKSEAAKLKQRSVHSYKKAMTSGPYMPTRSKVEVTHPVDFSFATDTRVKPHGMALRGDTEKAFETQLRQHPLSPSFKNRKITKPVPFHFAKEPEKKETSKPKKWESIASCVSNFQTKTPDRFRTHSKVKQDQPIADKKLDIHKLTEPKTPHLSTKTRKRPVTVQSHAEEEEKIIQEMKTYKFRARELNPRIIDHGGILGLPQKKEHPKTEPKPFEFMSDVRLEARKKKEEPETIGNAQTTAQRKRSSSSSSQKGIKDRCTKPEPFTFEQRNLEIQLKKEKKIQEIYEEEQRAREFHAQPLPSLSPDIVIHHEHKKTALKPFNLESERRHILCEQKWNEQVNRMKEEEKAKQIFKAKPNTVTHKAPFQPLKGQVPPTEFSSFKLNTEERAVKREEFDANLKEAQRLADEGKEERKMLEEKVAEEELLRLRQEAVPKANPIRKYKEVEVLPSDKPLTNPVTPCFETVKRSRKGIRC